MRSQIGYKLHVTIYIHIQQASVELSKRGEVESRRFTTAWDVEQILTRTTIARREEKNK